MPKYWRWAVARRQRSSDNVNLEIPMAIEKIERPETNPDPITGAPGAHPVGVGLGAAAGGIAAGAAAGTFAAGPIGTVVGAAIGAVVGGLAGKGAAESMNPTQEFLAEPESDLRRGTRASMDERVEPATGQRYSTAGADVATANGVADATLIGQSRNTRTTDADERTAFADGTQYQRAIASAAAGTDAAAIPSADDAYWRTKYRDEPYYSSSRSYDDYAPAYRLAHHRRLQSGGSYDASEGQLARDWESAKGVSRLTWLEARQATRAAWDRIENAGDATALADSVETSTGHLSDAAHRAWDQTKDRVAAADDGIYSATSELKRSKAMRTVRETVRGQPFAAIGIGMAVGFLLVAGPSLSRAITRSRWS
jgi:ElaB/YqjD/DUF883 family membrane-anchored ribosome-binding protein